MKIAPRLQCHHHLAQFYYLMHINTTVEILYSVCAPYFYCLLKPRLYFGFVWSSISVKMHRYKKRRWIFKLRHEQIRLNFPLFFICICLCLCRSPTNVKNMLLIERDSSKRITNAVWTFNVLTASTNRVNRITNYESRIEESSSSWRMLFWLIFRFYVRFSHSQAAL